MHVAHETWKRPGPYEWWITNLRVRFVRENVRGSLNHYLCSTAKALKSFSNYTDMNKSIKVKSIRLKFFHWSLPKHDSIFLLKLNLWRLQTCKRKHFRSKSSCLSLLYVYHIIFVFSWVIGSVVLIIFCGQFVEVYREAISFTSHKGKLQNTFGSSFVQWGHFLIVSKKAAPGLSDGISWRWA